MGSFTVYLGVHMKKTKPDRRNNTAEQLRILSRVVEQSPNSIMVTDYNGIIEYVNPRFEELTGYLKEEVTGKDSKILNSGKNSPKIYKDMWEIILAGGEWRGELCNRKKNGDLIWEFVVISGLQCDNGSISHFIEVKNDITESRKDKDEKQKLIKILNETGEIAKVGGWEFNLSTRTQTWTDETYRIVEMELGKNKEVVLKGVNFYTTLSRPIIKEAIKSAILFNEPYDLELEIITEKGNHRWVHTTGKANQENGITVSISGAIQDITDRKKAEDALRESEKKYRELSIIDDLTQLYNSRYFYDQIKKEIGRVNRYGKPLTIILLDIDNFKSFNDTYGHVDGNYVLSKFGQVVKKCLRQTDSSYRYGGEEFMIILPITELKKGVTVAEKIRKTFKVEVIPTTSGESVSLTISVGVAQFKQDEGVEDFVRRVDLLMYQAKKDGKDRVFS